jgi:hypothetical protein
MKKMFCHVFNSCVLFYVQIYWYAPFLSFPSSPHAHLLVGLFWLFISINTYFKNIIITNCKALLFINPCEMNYCFPFRFAQKNNLPVLQHVSLPRVGALQTIVDTVGPEKNSNPGGNSSGDPTVNCDGMNFVWNLNIFSI